MDENVNVVHACEREKRVHACTFVHSTLTKTIRPFRFIRYKNEFAFSESEAIQKKEVKNRLKVRILWRY